MYRRIIYSTNKFQFVIQNSLDQDRRTQFKRQYLWKNVLYNHSIHVSGQFLLENGLLCSAFAGKKVQPCYGKTGLLCKHAYLTKTLSKENEAHSQLIWVVREQAFQVSWPLFVRNNLWESSPSKDWGHKISSTLPFQNLEKIHKQFMQKSKEKGKELLAAKLRLLTVLVNLQLPFLNCVIRRALLSYKYLTILPGLC